VTVLDEAGGLVEMDQRALVRFVIQDGYGADVVFAAGTTGEWDRVDNRVQQRVIAICAEEVAKTNAQLGPHQGRGVEAWAASISTGRRRGRRRETIGRRRSRRP